MVASASMLGSDPRGLLRDDRLSNARERTLERVCQIVALCVSAGFASCAFWELADSFAAGHYAASSAVCTGAENMWRWGILAPVTRYTAEPPVPNDWYCHHPWGIFWISAPFMKLLGHRSWACRLPAALQSALTPPILYLAGRAVWGPVAGAVATACFAALPIALSFSDLNALEVPVIFGTTVAIWGYARFSQCYARRFFWLGVTGLGFAVCCDWAAAIFAALMLGALFVRAFILPNWAGGVADPRRSARFWGVAVALCTLAICGHLYTFQHFGQLNELLAQGRLRSTGSELPLGRVLFARKFWIEVCFTGLAIAIGKLALPVLALRSLLRRSELEALPLAVFGMALVQYITFKQAADVHVFWPHYFAQYFAFACAGLTQTAIELSRAAKPGRIGLEYACLGLLGAASLAILPDGLRALGYAHRSGGRFNENGHPIKPDKDKVAALEWLAGRMPKNGSVTLHPGMRQSLWVDWSLERPVVTTSHLPTASAAAQGRYYVADMRFMTASEQEMLAQNFSLTAIGPFLAINRAERAGQLRAFEVERVEPSWLQRYWVSSSHALRRIAPNPFLNWELRDRFDLHPNPPPSVEPTTFEERRIRHNIAVAAGDDAGGSFWLKSLLVGCDQAARQTFDDGNELLGSRLERGASLVYSVYFRASGPNAQNPELLLHSVVEAAPVASLVPKDETIAEVGMPFAIPANRWKRGYIYASITEVIRRIGRERWYGSFRSGSDRSVSDHTLLRLE